MAVSPHEGRRAIVVGGTHGIGLAIAEELMPGGAQAVVTGRGPSRARLRRDTRERLEAQ